MANFNNVDQDQKVQSEIQKIMERIAQYNQYLKDGKQVIELIKKYSVSYEKLDKKFLSKANNFQTRLTLLTETKDKIDNLQTSVTETLAQIEEVLTDVKTKTDELNSAYESFNQTKVKIETQATQIEEILTASTQVKSNIDNLNTSATQVLEQINTSLESVKAKIAEMNQAYEEFIKIKEAIIHPETGLQAILASSS